MTAPPANPRLASASPGPSLRLSLSLLLGGILGALSAMRGIFDPDYFWHVATGRLILETGRIPIVDPFSFTWAGRPWVPQVLLLANDAQPADRRGPQASGGYGEKP